MKLFGYDLQIKKASPAVTLPKGVENQLYRQLYKLFGNNMPVWLSDDLESYVQKGFLYNSDVYSIVSYILSAMTVVPWELLQRNPDGSTEPADEKREEVKRLREVLYRPNDNQTSWSAYVEAFQGYKLTLGNTYGYKMAAGKGLYPEQALSIFVMPSQLVTILGGTITNPVDGYQIRFLGEEKIPANQVVHSKYWNPDVDNSGYGLYGLSPIRAMARLITSSNDSFTAAASAFQNGGAMGVISQPSTVATSSAGSEVLLTQEQMGLIERTWKKKFSGASNFNKVAFTSAAIEYHQLGLSPVDLAILGAMKLSFQQLCRGWKFPSVLLNDNENSTYNNVSEAKKMLYTDCVMPELNRMADDLHPWLVKPFGDDLLFRPDFSAIEVLQVNKKEAVEWLEKAWWLSPNDKRVQMDYGKLEDPLMDKIYVPANYVPLEDLNVPAVSNPIEETVKELAALGISDYRSNGNGGATHGKH